MTRRIATPPLEWFLYLVTIQTFSSAFSGSLPEPFAYLPEEKLHAHHHVFEGKASWQSNTHVLTFRGWFLSVLFPVSQPVHQLSHVALITLLTNNLLHCTRLIFVYPSQTWFSCTKKKEKITFTVQIQCRLKKIKQNKTKKLYFLVTQFK